MPNSQLGVPRVADFAPPRAASGLSGFTQTTGERVVLATPGQGQKPALQPVPLKTKRYLPNSGRYLSFFPY